MYVRYPHSNLSAVCQQINVLKYYKHNENIKLYIQKNMHLLRRFRFLSDLCSRVNTMLPFDFVNFGHCEPI